MAGWTMEDGKIAQIQLFPITLGMEDPRPQKGVPRLAPDVQVLEYLQTLCETFHTSIRIENNVGYIDL